MQLVSLDAIRSFVEVHLPTYHDKRLKRLKELKLSVILKRKNPYLFRVKNIQTAEMLIRTLLDAHLSSQEETIFGDFLEELAVFVCSSVYGGTKSIAEGIDLEFSNNGIRYIVSVKSGPNWGNSSQIKRMVSNFNQAKRILTQRNPDTHIRAINGCCYGRGRIDRGDYSKLCGQEFWELISGNNNLYSEIIEPLGYNAKLRNEEFDEKYSQVLNLFSERFMKVFCRDGKIQWQSLLQYNSAKDSPGKTLTKSLDID